MAAAARSAQALAGLQKPEGYWCGDLRADTTLESDYVLLQLWLYPPAGGVWNPPTAERIRKARVAILARQQAGGGFDIYPGGPADVSASIKAYTALKLSGLSPEADPMLRLRNTILDLGGIQAGNSYVKINLSLFGLYPRASVPTVPPELVLLPGNILYEMSSWTRAIVVPLSIVQAVGGTRPVPPGFHLHELSLEGKSFDLPKRDRMSRVFNHIDRALKIWQRRGPREVQRSAVRAAEKWMLDHTRYSEGLGAIYPSMMYLAMALDALGYPRDHPDLMDALRQFDNLFTERAGDLYVQPCFSAVWDTAYAAFGLGEFGLAPIGPAVPGGRLAGAAGSAPQGRLERETAGTGTLRLGFRVCQRALPRYRRHGHGAAGAGARPISRPPGAGPLRSAAPSTGSSHMQSRDGGWAAFDVDNDWAILNRVPFADHNAMLDPTCPDITGRVLEALSRRHAPHARESIRLGVQYLLRTQERDGSWYGRWGVNYLYGTFLALRGLRASGESGVEPAIGRAARWVLAVQNSDGGWGESCASYTRDEFVAAPSTPSQTAWGLLAAMAAGDRSSAAFERGVRYLVDSQRADGEWNETTATGTGFPNVFYLRYTLYRNYFPLLALTQAGRLLV